MIVLYSLILIIMFWVLGLATIKLFRLQTLELIQNNLLIPIVIGFIVNLSILETVGLFVPLSIVTVINVVLVCVCAIWCRKDIKHILNGSKIDGKVSFIVVLIPIMVVGIPQILNNELFVVVGDNPDIAYYVSSMDWLKTHKILSIVGYSHSYPFFSMAEYMLDMTRIGTDVTGAFVANLFTIEVHEAFSVLAAISAVTLAVSVYSVVKYFTKNSLSSIVFGIYAAICANTIALVAAQYVPQIFGMSILLLTLVVLVEIFEEATYKISLLGGILISGTLATYCEYAVYIAIAAIILLVFAIIRRKIPIAKSIFMIFVAVCMNPFGFYKAVCFNVEILMGIIKGGASTIDPYGGRMLNLNNLFGNLAGFSSKEYLRMSSEGCTAIAIVILIGVTAGIVVSIIKKKKCMAKYVFVNLIIVFGLELYFRKSNGGYQEYKHITTSCALIVSIAGMGCGMLIVKIKRRSLRAICLIAFSALILNNVRGVLNDYTELPLSINSETMELGEIARNLPSSEPIRIDSEINWFDYMAAIYALKDHPINLDNKDVFEQHNWAVSYLHFFQEFDTDESRYTVYARGKELSILNEYTNLIWCNEKFVLVEDERIPFSNNLQITKGNWGYADDVIVFKESDSIVNTGEKEGYMMYGPYIQVQQGTYDVELEYSVISYDSMVGYFEIMSGGTEIGNCIINPKSNSIVIKDVVFDGRQVVEFRAYTEKGTKIKIEGISMKER